jgi:uncharacterized membrane protein
MEALTFDESGKVILPQPEDIPPVDREHAAGAYIMMFAAQYLPLPAINLIASIIYHAVCRKRSRFVTFHTWQSMISQIPTTVLLWALVARLIWQLVTTPADHRALLFTSGWTIAFIAVVLLWNLLYVIWSLIAYRRAGAGRLYYLPVFGKMAFARYFGPRALPATSEAPRVFRNLPPGG